MANESAKVKPTPTGSSWASFTQSTGGSSSDIRRSSATIRSQVAGEVRIFSAGSLMNGGTHTNIQSKK